MLKISITCDNTSTFLTPRTHLPCWWDSPSPGQASSVSHKIFWRTSGLVPFFGLAFPFWPRLCPSSAQQKKKKTNEKKNNTKQKDYIPHQLKVGFLLTKTFLYPPQQRYINTYPSVVTTKTRNERERDKDMRWEMWEQVFYLVEECAHG